MKLQSQEGHTYVLFKHKNKFAIYYVKSLIYGSHHHSGFKTPILNLSRRKQVSWTGVWSWVL